MEKRGFKYSLIEAAKETCGIEKSSETKDKRRRSGGIKMWKNTGI